jgi:hypothetical protein
MLFCIFAWLAIADSTIASMTNMCSALVTSARPELSSNLSFVWDRSLRAR